ncbi:hypothetical protein Tco_0200330, partial [Tanacetum coccineum]
YGYIKNHKKRVKNGQARTRESEEYKKKPNNQSRSQKSQTRMFPIFPSSGVPEDLSMTTTTTSRVPHRFGSWSDTRVSYDLVIFHKEHQCRLLRRGAWSSFEVSVGITKEGEVVTYLRFIANFSKIVKPHTSLTERNQKKERVKPRRVRAMAMTIQYGVRGMILAAQSEAFKQENVLAERLHGYKGLKTKQKREILLKMNLPDHRSVLTDPEDQAKMEMETPRSSGVNSPPNAHT